MAFQQNGQSAPLNQPAIDADYNSEFKPGIWYNMPVEKGDHMLWNGYSGNVFEFFGLYDKMLDVYRRLPDGD